MKLKKDMNKMVYGLVRAKLCTIDRTYLSYDVEDKTMVITFDEYKEQTLAWGIAERINDLIEKCPLSW